MYPDEYGVWLHDIGKCKCVDGESVEELGQRVLGTLTRIARENEGRTVVVATHATPVRVTQCLIEHGNLEKMREVPWVSNASVSEIEYCDGTWKCIKMSQDKHLGELCTVLPDNV